ncbi:MAG: twin-arginine translocation signal domain-containing protein, partial [Deltaproteobacteria bacterium]|nr:twin-arginine translocation signal domain-containing protein [Deltaproteobacteria bacterium]
MSDRNRLPVLQDAPAPGDAGASPSRRDFLRTAAAGAVIAAVSACNPDAVVEELQRRHLTELSKDKLHAMLGKLEKKWSAQFGKNVTVSATGPMPGVNFGYGLDLSRCVGCRRCVHACVKENNQSRRNPQIQW